MDDDNSNLLVAQLLYLDSIGKKDITMYVNSPGGSVTAGQPYRPVLMSLHAYSHLLCHSWAQSMYTCQTPSEMRQHCIRTGTKLYPYHYQL